MMTSHLLRTIRSTAVGIVTLATSLAALASSLTALAVAVPVGGSGAAARIVAVGAENEYANVIAQIGGRYVSVSAVMSNPNTDPHTFESSPKVAQAVAGAQLVVQNGLGYDDFMDKIEAASPNPGRKVVDAQKVLGLPDSTANPHLWYSPKTMPAVARVIGRDLATIDPAHKAYYQANVTKFVASLAPWNRAIAQLSASYPGAPVATTEPVADYLLEAAGLDNKTPFSFQADVMNGTDPAPQDVTVQHDLFIGHQVKAFVYNQQVTDTLTQSLLALAEVRALSNALAHGTSAPKL